MPDFNPTGNLYTGDQSHKALSCIMASSRVSQAPWGRGFEVRNAQAILLVLQASIN